MCAGGGRKEGRCNRYTRATVQTVRDRRFCENVNGDGSCCTICEEPATAPSPPVLRMYTHVQVFDHVSYILLYAGVTATGGSIEWVVVWGA